MGLFSTKTIVVVATHVSRVIEDKGIPDSVLTGTTRSVLKENQLVECIIDDALNGIGQRAERMFQYAGREYMFGRPTWKGHTNVPQATEMRFILNSIEGTDITIVYSNFGVLNYLHYAWQTIQNTYGYNQLTNELPSLTTVKGFPVYLEDIQTVLTEATAANITPASLAQWGISPKSGYTPERPMQNGTIARAHTPHLVDPAATQDHAKVTVTWKNTSTNVVHREVISIPLPVPDESDYFHVKYTKPGAIKYFTYRENDGTYPQLDTMYTDEYSGIGTFFPFGYFRYNKSSAKDSPGSTEYQHSKKLMGYLGIDYVQMANAIAQNPDIGDVDSALLMMAVPASSTNEDDARYLFDFFAALNANDAPLGLSPTQALARAGDAIFQVPAKGRSIVLKDARFTCSLSYSGIYLKYKYGTIGKIGKCTSAGHVYKKQLTETIYAECSVDGLRMAYHLPDGVTTADTLLVPLDRSITRQYSALRRERLYARSLHYVMNSRIEIKLKWYQQKWFIDFVIAVAIVLTAYSWGSTSSALAVAMTLGTLAVIEYVVIYMILIPLLIQQAIKLLVKELGPEFAMVAAIVLAVWAGVGAYNAGSIQGAPMAQDLLSLSSGLIREVGSYYTEQLKGLNDQAIEFSALAETKVKELEEANKLLEQSHNLSPFVIFGETPDEYYNRTVHQGNIGVVGLDAVSRYVDLKLTLPELKETISFDSPFWG